MLVFWRKRLVTMHPLVSWPRLLCSTPISTPLGDVWWSSIHGCIQVSPGLRFNIKMSSYQYRKSHCGDKTIVRPSYLHNGISYNGKIPSLYWIGTLKPCLHMCVSPRMLHCMIQIALCYKFFATSCNVLGNELHVKISAFKPLWPTDALLCHRS